MPVDLHQFQHGPYNSPAVRRGDKLFCEIRGTVTVGGYSHKGMISWPRIKKGGNACLVLCGDLVQAVRQEASVVVADHFGVSETTVWKWRVALGVEGYSPATRRLLRGVAELRPERIERARAASRLPAAIGKLIATMKQRGKPAHLVNPNHRFWTAEELALLGTASDPTIARRIGRT